MRPLTALALAVPFLVPAAAPAASQGRHPGRGLPTLDALASELARAPLPAPAAPADEALLRPGARLHRQELYGVPSLLLANPARRPAVQSLRSPAGVEAAARAHLAAYAHLYRMAPADLDTLELREVHDTGRGAVIARFGQRVDGVEVFRDELRVAMDREGALVALSGSVTGDATALRRAPYAFRLAAPEALSRGLDDLHGTPLSPADLEPLGALPGGWQGFALRPGAPAARTVRFGSPARARQVLFHHPDRYEPAWQLELEAGDPASTSSELYAYVVSAEDGRLLFRLDLTASESFGYRVWADTGGLNTPQNGPQGLAGDPHPTGVVDTYQAPFIAPSLITLEHGPIATNDPWLPATATVTTGNNVEAYADLKAPDGFGDGDLRAEITGTRLFDRVYDTSLAPDVSADQRKAAITQLFYDLNYFHDWYYGAGFTEAAGNAQDNNLGRGGVAGDSIKAEAQDNSGTDNANMSTPADGGRPRMQMYVWTGNPLLVLDVKAPAALAGRYDIGDALFGSQTYDVTKDLVAAVYGAGVTDGCGPFTNAAAVAGKIAFVDRGNCNFTVKASNAQAAGAVAVLVANNVVGRVRMAGEDASVTIGAMIVNLADGQKIRAALNAGTTVTARMAHGVAINRDGTIDNQIVAHEWGHYISNRLIGNAVGLSTNMARGMGEGWSDFHALLMTVRAADKAKAGNDHWQGVYGITGYVASGGENDGYYFGIRRAPYSTDLTKNPLTFKHIQDGVALPTSAPISFGQDGADNSEVHNAGEVWAQMLWECYAGMLNDSRYTFDQARDRMRDYLVAAYKLTPNAPTFLEARDALLAAALARDTGDFQVLLAAFAKRGAGLRAVSPDRYSDDNVGVVEDNTTGRDLSLVSLTLDDSVVKVCGGNGVLGNGETGKLTVTLRNLGPDALAGTTATVSSTDAHLTFPSGATLTFGSIPPFGTGSASVDAALSGVSGIAVLPLTLTAQNALVPQPLVAQAAVRVNTEDLPGQTATDDMESPSSTWTPKAAAGLDQSAPWRIIAESPSAHLWAAPQPGVASDQSIVSPLLQVSATQNLKVTFRHRHSFTVVVQDPNTFNMGGGTLEISPDDGKTWNDLGSQATPGYSETAIYGGLGNPLGGGGAWAGKNASFPGFDTVTVDAGALTRGQTVRLRFRLGASDYPQGSLGWQIDDVQIAGLVGLPFHALLPAKAACYHAPVANAGSPKSVAAKAAVSLTGSGTDADGDSLSYAWTQVSGKAVTLSGASTPTVTFTAPALRTPNKVVLALTVNDGTLSSAPSLVEVSVDGGNAAPVASAGPAQSVSSGALVKLDGTGSSDPDGDLLTYTWTQTAGPAVTLADATTPTPSFTAPSASVTFQLVVGDGLLTSAPATVTVTVQSGGCGSAPGAASGAALLPLALLLLRRRRAQA